MPLAEGQVFAGYTILGVLGTGGMGEVYLAEHPRLPRRDALKVLGTTVSDDAEYRQRFNQEAEMVATLRHPNIVGIYDRGDSDGQLWIAMEFIDGTDAYRLMTEKYRSGLPAELVVRIVTAVAEALDYAHSHDVLHRDIKPANILLASDRTMLADFGVARWVGQPSDLTGTDVTVGTVTYAAPEQLTGQDADGRADQYSLAATAFHLMTGTAPFADSNQAVVIGQHLSAKPPAIGELRPALSAFGPAFARALAKMPTDRYDRCRDFAEAMQRALDPASAAASGRHHRRPAIEEGSPERRRWIAAGLGGLVLLGAGGAAIAVLSRDRAGSADSLPTAPPPPAVSARMDLPVVVVGADCAVLGAAAVTENGAPAYCARASSAGQTTVWSLQPERLRTATSQPAQLLAPPSVP